MKSLDGLILKLDIPKQKPLHKFLVEKPDLSEYPIEYRYLDRILYRLGSLFYGYKFADLPSATLEESIIYALSGRLKSKMINLGKEGGHYLDYCHKLGINILVIGPDLEDFQFFWADTEKADKPFLVLLKSYEGLHYPLVHLAEERTPSLFMYQDSKLIRYYISLFDHHKNNKQ